MLEICQSQGEKREFRFNPNKSCLFTIGKDYKELLANMHFGGGDITRVDTMKYLGIHFILSKRVKIDNCPFLRKFNASVNAVMAHSKFVNEDVKLRLFESFALPLLTYGLNVLFLSALN